MSTFVSILASNPLVLLFLVAALGYAVGQIKIRGVGLGVAAVLFVGLIISALDPALKLPEIVYQLGLVLFVYTIGLASGSAFFASFRSNGLRYNAFIGLVLIISAFITLGVYVMFHLSPAVTAGLFAGALTNTPALAAVLDFLKQVNPPDSPVLSEPVVGYSIAYPYALLGVIFSIVIAQRVWKFDYAREAESLRHLGVTGDNLVTRTIEVTQPAVAEATLSELTHTHSWDVVFVRILHGDHMHVATSDMRLSVGDRVSVIGDPAKVDRVIAALGKAAEQELAEDRHEVDFRRIFVSNPEIIGRRLHELQLPQKHDAIITRVRRGDIEFLANRDTVLDLGDRVRVVTRRENMGRVTTLLGDSYRALSEVDILSFGLGIAIGLLVGAIPIPFVGGVPLRLGAAAGPLIVGLIFGAVKRTGPIVWTLPYNANLTLRQAGLILFLAGVGTRSGYEFVRTLSSGNGLTLFVAGAIITTAAAVLCLVIGYKLFKIPGSLLIGMLAGMETQPAVLGYATEQTGNEIPNVGYTTVYPMAMIVKILIAQLLVMLLK
ncbi:MAG: aspartate:alanine exchanger family transporter [Anaerolineae bacterium]